MRIDNASSSAPFSATEHWSGVANLFQREFDLHGIEEIETGYFNLRFSGFAPGDPRLHRYLLYTYFRILRQRDSLGLLDKVSATCPVLPGFGYMIDGCRVSLDLLLSIDEFYSLLEAMPNLATDAMLVAEIGAGWGRLGYLLKKVNPLITYIVFDLPEILLISSSYLPRLLPDVSYGSYEHGRQLRTLDHDALTTRGMWFFGAQDFAKVKDNTFDIVVNIASFQEMTKSQVNTYIGMIDKKTRKEGCLYVKQLWSGKVQGHKLTEIDGYTSYEFPASWQKVFLRNVTFSQDFFEAAFRII